MADSFIVSRATRALNKLRCYSHHSMVGKGLKACSDFIGKQVRDSAIIGFFSKNWHIEEAWKNSIFYSPLGITGKYADGVMKNQKILNRQTLGNSVLLAIPRNGLRAMAKWNTRAFGVILLAAVLSEGLLQIVQGDTALLGIILRGVLAVCALLFIMANRTIEALYEGSWVLRFVINFFKVGGMDDAASHK